MSTSSTTPIMTAETETIPEDVQQMAIQFRCCSSDGCIRADDECGEQGRCIEGRQIARAILAERERAAKVAQSFIRYGGSSEHGVTINPMADAQQIARAIRNPPLVAADRLAEERAMFDDALTTGSGFMVDGKRVAPETVRVAQAPKATP